MLASLLLANRRAELIQLAVDGYLTLIATVDEEKAYLNRTTRASFLSRLAVELEVEKRTFSQADLIKFTEEFSKEFDFDDLQPLPFINSFVQKGILVFEESGVQFTLPFVKSYLLAVALKEDEQLATRHFVFEDDNFDFETFDLYCELGPCPTIVNSVEERLGADIEVLSSSEKKDAFLFGNELRPSILKNSDRLGDIRTGIERTITRLQGQNNDGDGKQRLLDIADNANAQAEKQAGDEAADSAADQSKVSRSAVDDLIRDWRIGSVLLGSAAQRLVGTRKQALASLLIRGAAILSDQLTMTYSSVDFDEIKSSALNSREATELLASFASEKEREEMKQQVAYLIDFVELYVLALPFRTVLNQLCDQCSDKVLIGPVSKALVVGKLGAVIQFSWLSDLDSKRGAKGLRQSISNIPVAPFFRMMLAQHFLSRVYWAQWRPVDRSALLNAAADVVKGLGASLKKGELGRLIGQGASTDADKRGK